MLEGSVRRAGNRVRINAQLVSAVDGTHVWAERFDREITDVFALQDAVTRRLVTALAITLTQGEEVRLNRSGEVSPEAYDMLLRGLERLRRFTPEDNRLSRDYFEQALALDPNFARAHADLAFSHATDFQSGWTASPEEALRLAKKHGEHALELDPSVREVHFAMGSVYLRERRFEDAINSNLRAIQIDPNYADAYGQMAWIMMYAGRAGEALELIEKAMRLNPHYPFAYSSVLGEIYFQLKRFPEAAEAFEATMDRNPQYSDGRRLLAATYQPVDEVFPGRSRHGLILWCPGLKGGSLMAMGQQKDRQGDLMVSWSEMPRSPGHVFYDRLQLVLIEGGFDGFAEAVCQPYYAARMGAPSVPPGRYFRMHLAGYFEGIDSERGLEWRCSDSLSLREFLLLEMRERVPDHSWLSRTRARLPHEVHTAVFDWVLALIAEAGLVKGERIGVDASTMEANAALRNIVRRDTGEGYRGMLERLAQESGIETPTAEDLARLDRKRKGKKLSNQDWVSRSDPEAKIAKMKDGTTYLAYKPEHAVDLDTGAVVAAELHPADEGDTTTLPKTLAAAEANLEAVDVAPTAEDPAECVTDKGYHSRLVLKALDDGPWKSRISEPKQKGFARWHGDDAARRAVTNNRTRLLSGVAREAFKLRAEIVERSFAHNLDRGGMRRTWLRGRENVHKRYLLHVAGHNLSLLMRQLIGAGTPKEAVAGGIGALFVLVTPAGAVLVVQIVLIVSEDGETAFAAICFAVA